MQIFKKILYLLTPSERRQASLLLLMILIMALLDVIGVASILPFMAVLSNPEVVQTNIIINKIFLSLSFFGVRSTEDFLFALGILVFILLVFSLFFKAITTYLQLRFVNLREFSIGKRLVESYLHQPYSWFLNRHTADLGKSILSEVGLVIGNGLSPLLELIAKSVVAIALIVLLILTDPKLALVVGLCLGGAYVFIFYLTRSYLSKIGKLRLKSNELRFISVAEVFGAIKEVKYSGLEQNYVDRFSDPAKIFAKTTAASQVVRQIPRFILEAIAFGGIMLVIIYFMSQTGSFNNALPILSLYVFAGYRLMPALQQVYASFTQLTFVSASLDKLYDDVKNLDKVDLDKYNKYKGTIAFNKVINLNNIFYSYPNASNVSLKDISINIPSKTTIGIVGSTGSGKTTTVDIILGLLKPQKGTLEVDGEVITEDKIRIWQSQIGYVPQHIYLTDDTVAANIAFGVNSKDICQERIKIVSKIANLHEFVINELPKNYQTKVGEQGVRLSGGQRQRIGIARALYQNPKLLIFDEATSALDNLTEKEVMNAVNKLSKNITIILIAHRLSTVKKCDKIFILEKGEVKNSGKFEELMKVNDNFRLNVNN